MDVIYLDYNATTPIDVEVADFMIPFLKGKFGNPSSTHEFGIESRKEIELARMKVAKLLNCKPFELIFTSGGTESNNLALRGAAYALRENGNHIITSKIEHPAVLEVCKQLEKEGFSVSYLDVNEKGVVSLKDIKDVLRDSTILVSIMHANNEVGSIQPIAEISELLRGKNILLHTDAAQSIGKIPTDVKVLGVDLLSVAGHKFYGPKGIGALFIKDGVGLVKQMHGADHEHNIRPGTENVLEIAGLGKAAEIALRDLEVNAQNMKFTRDLLYNSIIKEIPEARRNGDPGNSLPNTLNISFPGLDVSLLFSEMREIAASAGAACHTDQVDISHVLEAMKISQEYAMGTLRLSTGKHTTQEEIERAVSILTEKVKLLSNSGLELHPVATGTKNIKLTQYTHGLGCACKISPKILEDVLKGLRIPVNPDILVGPETSDDASVYKINEETAIVQSLDFFTPVIDDPYEFGSIAAVNALSDIYAMGAKPLFGLNIVGFPHQRLPIQVLKDILKGAQDVCDEAGIPILGGHTIEDNEPKFGMVISGIIHPQKIIKNKGANPGDVLILTKAIGTGILSTALKRGLLDEKTKDVLYNSMRQLNKLSSELMTNYNPTACTDVTGFGLLGHLKELCEASGVSAEVSYSMVPLLPGVEELVNQGIVPGGTENNLRYLEKEITWEKGLSEYHKIILCDAQTSGGLLISIPDYQAERLLQNFVKHNQLAISIGKLVPLQERFISISK
ncbi:MAG: selenide, water dikinase SelD [Bacteroidales bacterium]|nr:selenide, water dikinase SelD [Bacteroidales bacterium]